jgi:putative membrane protein insertion efficiency factor
MITLIRFYQRWISPAFPARCKYYPTCSTYALLAIRSRGALAGTVLTVWRIVRCNPWSMGGIDYPPGGREIMAAENDQNMARKVNK